MSSLSSSSLGTSDIVGIVIGGVLALVTIIAIAMSCYSMCCKKKNPSQVGAYPPPNYYQNPPPYYQQTPYGQPTNTGYYPQQSNRPPQDPNWGPQPTNNVQQNPYYAPKSNY